MGNRPVTLCTCQWADLPFDELCALASKMGYDGLEVACWGNGIDIDRAYSDDSYVAWIKETLAKNNLICKALACHIIGQCVGDAPDPRLNNFAPAALADKPEEIRAWAIDTMKMAPVVAKKLGCYVVTGFTGSPIWKWLYSFPQTTEEMVENGYDEIVRLWSPILDEFKANGIKFALEVHPGEIAFDYYSTEKLRPPRVRPELRPQPPAVAGRNAPSVPARLYGPRVPRPYEGRGGDSGWPQRPAGLPHRLRRPAPRLELPLPGSW